MDSPKFCRFFGAWSLIFHYGTTKRCALMFRSPQGIGCVSWGFEASYSASLFLVILILPVHSRPAQDAQCKTVIQGMLNRQPKKRLGAGEEGPLKSRSVFVPMRTQQQQSTRTLLLGHHLESFHSAMLDALLLKLTTYEHSEVGAACRHPNYSVHQSWSTCGPRLLHICTCESRIPPQLDEVHQITRHDHKACWSLAYRA